MCTQQIDFTAGTNGHPNDPHVKTPAEGARVAVLPAAQALSTLSRIDDEDAFLVEIGARERIGRASSGPTR